MGVSKQVWSLRRRFIFSHMLIAIIAIFSISILANLFLEKQFKDYVINNHEQKSKEIINSITEQYMGNGKWNQEIVERIGIDGLENGLISSLKDAKGVTIWDATVHNHGLCEEIISHMSQNMMARYSNWKGGYVKKEYPVIVNSQQIGIITIGYYGPYYYSDNDIMFLNTLNKIFVVVGVVSLCLALIFGILMSEGLSRPISKVINAAEMISHGHYDNRIIEKSNISELSKLIGTVNNLAKVLENQEVLRKRLTADVAHELRTPLATLQSHMEAMIDGVWEPTVDRIKSCHEETIRINRLVGDMDKLSQYESENLILNKTEFDISEVINNILLNFETEYRNKNIGIIYDKQELSLYADKDKISQIIVNLFSNALKYTPEGGKVVIEAVADRGNVILSIKDSGIGISEEDLPHIFERFYRADKSRNRMTGGAGIGLSIVKSIVDAHDGVISVNSEISKGTEFKVYLPVNI